MQNQAIPGSLARSIHYMAENLHFSASLLTELTKSEKICRKTRAILLLVLTNSPAPPSHQLLHWLKNRIPKNRKLEAWGDGWNWGKVVPSPTCQKVVTPKGEFTTSKICWWPSATGGEAALCWNRGYGHSFWTLIFKKHFMGNCVYMSWLSSHQLSEKYRKQIPKPPNPPFSSNWKEDTFEFLVCTLPSLSI